MPTVAGSEQTANLPGTLLDDHRYKASAWYLWGRIGVSAALLALPIIYVLTDIPHEDLRRTFFGISAERGLIVGISLLVINAFCFWLRGRAQTSYCQNSVRARMLERWNLAIQMTADWVMLSYLVLTSGQQGLSLIFFFLIHALVSVSLLTRPMAIAYLIFSSGLVVVLGGLLVLVNEVDLAQVVPLLGTFIILLTGIAITQFRINALRAEAYNALAVTFADNQRLSRQRTHFLVDATHHLKTPLVAILNLIQMLKAGYSGEIDEQAESVLARVIERSNGALEHVDKALWWASLNATPILNLPRETFPVLSTTQEVIKEMNWTSRVGVHVPSDAEPCELYGAPEIFRRFVRYAVENALQYSQEEQMVNITFAQVGRFVEIKIADKGIGIRQENREKVFLPYFRGKEGVRMTPSSSGLGLTICLSAIELQGGSMQLESDVGKGTTLIALWPANPFVKKE